MKICVIALPRSGSSTLCRHLADEHALKNIGEVHKTSSGSVPNLDRDNIVFKLIPQHIRAMVLKEFIDSELSNQPKYLSTLKKQRYASNEAMYDLTVKNNHILFPRAVDLAKDIISKSDTRIFLCRRDLTA